VPETGHLCPVDASLLIIEDEELVRSSLAEYFRDSGYTVHEAENGLQGVELFKKVQPDLIFTDLRMPVMNGLTAIKLIKELSPDTPIIVISGTGVVKDAVDSLRHGAWDYVEKPVYDLAALEHMVKKALENSGLRRQVAVLKQKLLAGGLQNPEAFAAIITRSPAMLAIFQYIEVMAPTAQPLLITGETGTGKELMATAIHRASRRSGKFVAVNVAGLDDQMLSDTLFGHGRGAFTGADRPREGLIAQAAGGTLFLDEIGDLNESSQIKLLRLLQEGEYFPLGSDHPRKCEARIVLATHRDLKDMVAKGTFRQDLYYRLFAHQIAIPPLRERPDDIPLLVEKYLLEAAEALGKKKPATPVELPGYLQTCRFNGNVRELKAMVFEAVSRHSQGMLPVDSFFKAMGQTGIAPPPAAPGNTTLCITLASGEQRLPTLAEAEELLIDQALTLADNNQGIAAGYLGINRSALNKRLQKRK
jgi:DNA-binding NtrC family response regulator